MELANPLSYLHYSFGVKALLSAVLSGVVCSAVGTHVVLRNMSFVGAGISHVAFAGIAFGFLVGGSPVLWAMVFSLTAGLLLWYLGVRRDVHYDITIGVLFAVSMGLAVVFLSFSNKYSSSALSYLFGSPLSAETTDIVLLLATLLFVVLFYGLFWRDIYMVTFSQDMAKASGYNVDFITFCTAVLISVVVTLSIKAVGALLVFSLLVMPPASAYRLSRSYGEFFALSVLFGALSSLAGIFLSFAVDVPSGASITLASFLIFAFSLFKNAS